jgi:hypothetical protein
MEGLGNSGYMTMGAFEGFEQQAQSALDSLEAGGMDRTTALQSMAPMLAQLQAQSETYGIALDANTQALIDEAEAAGVAFPTDPMQQMVKIMGDLTTVMCQAFGVEIPESVALTQAALEETGDAAAAAGDEMAVGLTTTVEQMEGATQASATEMLALIQQSGQAIDSSMLAMLEAQAAAEAAAAGTATTALDGVSMSVDQMLQQTTQSQSMTVDQMSQMLTEAGGSVDGFVDAASESFVALDEAAIEGTQKFAEDFVGGMANASDAACDALGNVKADLLDITSQEWTTTIGVRYEGGGRGGEAPRLEHGGVLQGNVLHAASGVWVPTRPRVGTLVQMGEGSSPGGEVATPVAAIYGKMADIVAGKVAAAVGRSGGQGTAVLEIDSRVLGEVLYSLADTGRLRLPAEVIAR